MQKIKILFPIIAVAIMTACSAEYTLEIDENLTFTEKISLAENNEFFIDNGTTAKQFVAVEESILKNVKKYENFDYEINYENNITSLQALKKYDTFDYFKNNSLMIGSLFDTFNIEIENDVILIETFDYNGHAYFGPRLSSDEVRYSDISVIIKSDFELISTNADVIDEVNGIYTWKYDNSQYNSVYTEPSEDIVNETSGETENFKNIEISFNTKKTIPNSIIDVLISIWYIPAILLIITISAVYIKGKKYVNNKI